MISDLPPFELAFPGPLRDKLVAAVLDGSKTSTTGLVADYEHEGEALPEPGERHAVIDSAGRTVAVIETTEVRVVPLAEVDVEHAVDEGEGHTTVAEWRADHETFWHGPEMREAMDDPEFTVDDATLAVLQRFRLVADLRTRVRPATAADAREIARVHLASRKAAMPYLPPQVRNLKQVTRWVEDVHLKLCRTWVAERDGEIAGYATLNGDVLDHLYVHPEAWRRGAGTLLLDEVKRHGPGVLRLHVFQKNTAARAFYERHGFTVVDATDGRGNMEGLPDLTMEWSPGE